MFCGLSGKIVRIFEDSIAINIGSIDYLVQISESLLSSLVVNDAADLILETKFKVDKIVLFGFLNEYQQFCFNKVSSISGVSDRTALNLSGYFTPSQLLEIINSSDENLKVKISGVGAKTWEKIIFSLKRNKSFIKECIKYLDSGVDYLEKNTIFERDINEKDAVSALTNIGINKNTASDLVSRAVKTLGTNGISTEKIVKLALALYSSSN